ncbi:uclacyanin 1-like [Telopea speciosissima]|uniref:uclacyanin 1-like n=1 Tax=Telopea speciosissima TaxID=54955 RepID=UPI001CC381F8|nr:uclacyanin 1-like [Telopea speciosissima]
MAMFRALLSLIVIPMLVEFAMGANYTVGGSNGWDLTSNLQAWSAAQSFHVGDNLIFQYSSPHNLAEVTKSDYDSCQATNALQVYSDGNTVITLTTPGKRYFTCGVPGHCTQGMKLQVDTLATSAATAPSPSTATSPSTLPNIATSPTPAVATAPSATPPSPSVATAPSVIPPSPAVATAPSATPPLPSTATLAPFSPPSLAPDGSVPSGLSPILPSSESPGVAPSGIAFTTPPPPSTSSANRGHLQTKLLIVGICFGMKMLQAF